MKRKFFCKIVCFLLILACGALSACHNAQESMLGSSAEASKGTDLIITELPTEKEPQTVATEPITDATTATVQVERPKVEPKEFQLRVGSYNIKHGGEANLDMTKLAEAIVSLDLDVVGLQEVDQKTTRVNGIDTMKTLSEATGYPYYCFFKAINYKGGEYGLGVLSKYPILSSERIMLVTPSSIEQRILGRAELDIDGFSVHFFVTHLSHNSREIRSPQFAGIANTVKSYDNFIVTGDFNTVDFSEYAAFENAAMVNNAEQSLVTTPSSKPIDNIVYSKDTWIFQDTQVLKESYSDHYLLYSVGTFIP